VLDVCSVCGGNGTSCIGCDGIPNSGLVYDRCGICGGDGTTCYSRCDFVDCNECTRYGEGCVWCNSLPDGQKCYDSSAPGAPSCDAEPAQAPAACPNFWENLSTLEQGLTIGAIAGIVIGAVAGVAFLTYGGKKGYDYWAKQRGLTGEVHNSPLYQDRGQQGTNPFYEDPSSMEMK
jgi:hypothetical protein